MTEDVSAGRLWAEVAGDTTGFARDLRAKIDAEVKGIRAKIKAEIDQRGLVAQAKVAAKTASQAATVRFKVDLDTSGLVAQAKTAAAAASQAATVRLRADVDTSEVITKSREAAAAASTGGVDVSVGADTTEAEVDVAAFKARTRAAGVSIPVRADTGSLSSAGTALMQLSKAPAIAGGVFLLGTAIVQVGGGLIAMASSASQAVGVLGAIPNLIGVIGQGAAALLIGVSGVGDALKAMGKAEEAATTATATGGATARATARAVEAAAKARASAARGVEDAQRSLADAQHNADETAQRGARAVTEARRAVADAREAASLRESAAIERISDAEWSLARAQETAQEAQQSLTRAREQARERIDDLNMALRHSALDEEAAILAVEQARQSLEDANWNPMTSDLQQKQADLAYRQSIANLEEIRERNGDLKQETDKANKAGVDGSEEVENARDGVRDSMHAEQEAAEALVESQAAAAREQRDSARAIADAQRGLADTIESNAEAAASSARQVADAHRGIADAQLSLADAEDNLAEAQQTAAAGGTQAKAAADAAAAALAKLSPAGQRFVEFLFGLKPKWIDFRNTIQEALLPPIQRGITAAMPLLSTLKTGLVGSATVVGGLVEKLGRLFGEKTFNRDVATIMASNNRAMASFGLAGLNLVRILQHLAVAAGPLVEKFARWTRTLTAGWLETVKVKRATGELADFFDRSGTTAAQLGRILGNVAAALFNIGKAAAPSGQQLLASLDRITAKWQAWTGSTEGQERMREFFDAVRPVTEEFGKLLLTLGEFILKTSEGGSGPMLAFLQTLNLIVGGLNRLMSVPGVAPAIGALLTLAGVGGALGLVSGLILRMGKNIGKLAKVTGLKKLTDGLRGSKDAIDDELPSDKKKKDALDALDGSAKKSGTTLGGKFVNGVKAATSAVGRGAKALGGWIVAAGRAALSAGAFTARLVAQRVAIIAGAVASGIARAATAAWTAMQWLLNVAMNANPLGLVVLAIGLLVGALIYAYRNSEVFRAVVTRVWAAIQTAVSWAWGHVIKPVLTGMWSALQRVGAVVKWLWEHAIKPYLGFIRNLISLYWNYYLKPILTAFWTALQTLGRVARWLWEKAIGPALRAIRDLFKSAWENVIKPAWNALTGAIKWGWEHVISPAFEAIKTGVGKLAAAFNLARDAVKTAWDKIKQVVKDPIRGVIDLINTWVIGKFNWVSSKLGGPKIDPIDLAGFREGGPIPGKRRGARADNVVIRATPGEEMIRRWAADKMRRYAPGALEYINKFGQLPGYAMGGLIKRARGLLPGYADGGFVRPVGAPWSGSWGKYASGGNHPALDFPVPVGTQVGAVMDGVVNAVRSLAGSYGKHIRISHANGIESIYAHLSDMIVSTGQRVSAGQAIGRSGNTGNSTGPHLHLELRRNGSAFDFTSMLESGKAATSGGKNALQKLLGGINGKIKGIVGEPLEWFRSQLDQPAEAFKNKFGNTEMAQMLTRIPYKLIGSAAARVKSLLGLMQDKAIVSNPSLGLGAVSSAANRAIVQSQAATRGWTGKQWAALDWLVRKESSYNNLAQNPTSSAYGLFQFLDGTWSGYGQKTSDPNLQAKYGLKYIAERYGNPMNARAFHLSHNWYDKGGWLRDDTVPHNTTGKPEAVLTNPQWSTVDDILSILARVSPSLRTVDATGGGRAAAMVENLTVQVEDKRDLPQALDEVDFKLRRIRQGGVYARRTP